ncbi:MAG TPA: MgtC/SapB family protein [Beijerinckiaceae bacterium]|nr:MgtC/SapB family protein [Beijerinckiaceae bacterium]
MDAPLPTTFLPDLDTVARLVVATAGGLLLGLDREMRGHAAGIRTHALVSLSSAMITLSALLLYNQIAMKMDYVGLDPLRAIQGLAQAIGFIAAGTIIVAKGDVHNLTSAANIWLACAFGIAAGAGQFGLALAAFVLGVFVVTVVRILEHFIPGSNKTRHD